MSNTDVKDQIQAEDVSAIDALRQDYALMCDELGKVIVGQKSVIERLAICLFAQGHALLIGVPGLAKTMLVKRLAETMDLSFSRIQFTPDLMPMDITGTEILHESDTGRREFEFVKGPVFASIVLADEINRAPSKTQAAMLEAMQEHRVTAAGHSYPMEEPFFVLATQNPIEQEGTYPLPEAQLDRFMFMIDVGYPSLEEEIEIGRLTTGDPMPELKHVIDGQRVKSYQKLVRRVPVPDHIYQFAAQLVRRTRPSDTESPDWLKPLVSWGAGPRAMQYLILGAKSRAALLGSYMVRLEDIVAVAEPVLMHRVLTSFGAESEGIDSRQIVHRLVSELEQEG